MGGKKTRLDVSKAADSGRLILAQMETAATYIAHRHTRSVASDQFKVLTLGGCRPFSTFFSFPGGVAKKEHLRGHHCQCSLESCLRIRSTAGRSRARMRNARQPKGFFISRSS